MSSRPNERPWDARERERREQAEFEAKLQKAREERQKKLQAKRKKDRDSQSHLQRAAAKDGFDSLKSYIRRAKVRSVRDLVKAQPAISTPEDEGASADLLILEEAAFIPEALFLQVVLPLMSVDVTALIGISTPSHEDEGGYYGRIMRSLNARTGEPVFHVLHLRSACLSCLETLDDPSKCPHLHLALPSHQSQRKQESVTALYGAQNKDVMARETLGISIEGVEGKFHKGVVKQLFAKARVEPPIDPKRIFVAIDPNGGRSGFAICSGIRTGGNLTIVGMEVKQIQNHDQLQELLIGHLNELRRRFPGRAGHPPWLVILPESNLGFESAAIAKMVKPFPRTVCALETKQGSKWGLLLTQDIKVAFADYADEQLRMNAIDFSNNMVSCNLERCMEDLRSQLLNYRAVYTNGHKLTYSGKVDTNGKPALKDDDLVISLQMLLYYSSAAMQGRLKSLAVAMGD